MKFDVEKWLKERRQGILKGVRKLDALRNYLYKKGYKYIVVHYDGCGDSGEAYHAEGYKSIKSFKERDNDAQYKSNGTWNNSTSKYDPPANEWEGCNRGQASVIKLVAQYNKEYNDKVDLHYDLTDLIDYDWYNNEGGQGQVKFDLKKGEIFVDVEYNERVAQPIKEWLYTDGKPAKYQY